MLELELCSDDGGLLSLVVTAIKRTMMNIRGNDK